MNGGTFNIATCSCGCTDKYIGNMCQDPTNPTQLGAGAIVGIVIGILALLAIVIAIICVVICVCMSKDN